jgi:cyanophycin synthetase
MVDDVLAAVAAAWALDIPWPLVEATLATSVADAATLPGRLNLFRHRGATILADRGHNSDALLALAETLDGLGARGRRTLVIGIPTARRNRDVRRLGRVAADRFDRVILCRDTGERGQGGNGLARDDMEHGARARQVDLVSGEIEAIESALAQLGDGDACVVLLGEVGAGLARIAALVDGA